MDVLPGTSDVFERASELGFGRPLAAAHAAVAGDDWYRRVDGVERAIDTHEWGDRGQVLVPFVHGLEAHNAFRTCVLAHAFRRRGVEPTLVACDAALPVCRPKAGAFRNNDRTLEHRSTCDRCTVVTERILSAFGFDPVSIADFDPADPGDADCRGTVHRRIDVSAYALASTRRFFRRYTLDLDEDQDGWVYDAFLAAAKQLVDVAEGLIESGDYVATLVHNEQYVDQGVFLAVSEKHGVPAYSHGGGFRKDTVVFGRNPGGVSLPPFSEPKYVRQVVDTPLTDEQEAEVRAILADRFEGRNLPMRYAAETDRGLELREGARIGVFTNLIWDASIEAGGSTFPDPLTWIDRTIKWVTSTEGMTLVVKTHPAEAIYGTDQRIDDWILERHGPPDGRLRVLPPDTEVNTYRLLEEIDAAVVYNSTVGLEAAYRRVPTIVAGGTHYRGLGFTFDPETEAEYVDLLAAAGSLEMDEEMQRRARRYAHFLFVRKHLDFPPIPREGQLDLREIDPGNETFDRIVERVLAGTVVESEPL